MVSRRALLGRTALALAASRFLSPVTAIAVQPQPYADGDPFKLGVASGDPRPDGFVLWTRPLGLSGTATVGVEIADDDGFRRIVRSGSVTASPARGHAVHVEPVDLDPARTYFYRFHLDGATSPIGRTATIDPQATRMRLALAACQHWEHGWFSAYRDMVAQEINVLLHVGDYIYEKSFGTGPDVRSFGAPDPFTLDEYRVRHALYRTDPDLQAATAAFPIIATWDDHEVENDYASLQGSVTEDPAAFVARRAAAYQAWFEHMPISPRRLTPHGAADIVRRFEWGALASLSVLDCRQFRTSQPCGRGGQVIADCAEVFDPVATMLGLEQEAWLRDRLANERTRWSLIGQATMVSRLPLPGGGDARWSDIWDGYAASRDRLIAALRQPAVRNAVLLGGDVHSFWANDIPSDPERMEGPVVASEIVTSCLASRSGPEELFTGIQGRNPQVRFHDNDNAGYTLLDIDAERIDGRFRAVRDLTDPNSASFDLRRFAIEDRAPGVRI
ncbi:hypothetical protein A8B77_04110 [Erythrobacter sp. EhN03]|uniref:alkaline phosphatase D family protein n=1 Tax=Qipengyuania flava TaxID=192812 RepID=UPI0007F4E3BD|nr:hypothetical protein A8B77_04110 [Erythrobacter sp. EhN03]